LQTPADKSVLWIFKVGVLLNLRGAVSKKWNDQYWAG